MSNRVVVTGFGLITPFGYGNEACRAGVFSGKHAFKEIKTFDTTAAYAKFGGEADVRHRSHRHFIEYCAAEALSMAGLNRSTDQVMLQRAVVAVGSMGDGGILKAYYEQFVDTESELVSGDKHTLFEHWDEMISIHARHPFKQADVLAEWIGSKAARIVFTNACVASANAIGYGYDQIRKERASIAIVGGVNVLHPLEFLKFDSNRALAEDIVRPFSKDRKGLLIGDGAGVLILESYEHALLRGGKPLAEMIGWGLSSDGFHVTQPEPNGRGMMLAMHTALRCAECLPSEIDYVNVHGTGTPLNDVSETKALKGVFGEREYCPPVSSTKSVTGHMLEATGAVEAIISIMALQDQRIPPTANYLEADEGLDLDYVVEGSRSIEVRRVMSNTAAFGGMNCSLIFQQPLLGGD